MAQWPVRRGTEFPSLAKLLANSRVCRRFDRIENSWILSRFARQRGFVLLQEREEREQRKISLIVLLVY